MDKRLSIICSTDENYVDHFITLANSIKQNARDCDIYVRLIHTTGIYPGVKVIPDNTPLNDKKTIIMNGLDQMHPRMGTLRNRLISEKHCYAAHSKFLNAKYLLDQGAEYILILDADTVVRQDLSGLIALLDKHEFLARIEPRNEGAVIPINRVILCEGVMAIRNTGNMRFFFDSIVSTLTNIRDSKYYDIDTDTVVLSELFHRRKNNIAFHELPVEYKDTTFNTGSYIWSGQGHGRGNPKYIKERQLYEA